MAKIVGSIVSVPAIIGIFSTSAPVTAIASTELIVTSDLSIVTGVAIQSAINTASSVAACFATEATIATTVFATSPMGQRIQQNAIDYTSSLFPGTPAPNVPGFWGWLTTQLSPSPPEESLR